MPIRFIGPFKGGSVVLDDSEERGGGEDRPRARGGTDKGPKGGNGTAGDICIEGGTEVSAKDLLRFLALSGPTCC